MTSYTANLHTAAARIARAPRPSKIEVALVNWQFLFDAGRYTDARAQWVVVESLWLGADDDMRHARPSCRGDDPCSLEEPCPAHEAVAAACRAQGVSVAIDLRNR